MTPTDRLNLDSLLLEAGFEALHLLADRLDLLPLPFSEDFFEKLLPFREESILGAPLVPLDLADARLEAFDRPPFEDFFDIVNGVLEFLLERLESAVLLLCPFEFSFGELEARLFERTLLDECLLPTPLLPPGPSAFNASVLLFFFFFSFLAKASLAINRRQQSNRRRTASTMAMTVPRFPVINPQC